MLPAFQKKKTQELCKIPSQKGLQQQRDVPPGQLQWQKVMDLLRGASKHPQDLQHPHPRQGLAPREGHTDTCAPARARMISNQADPK